jgi:hypothetical protein
MHTALPVHNMKVRLSHNACATRPGHLLRTTKYAACMPNTLCREHMLTPARSKSYRNIRCCCYCCAIESYKATIKLLLLLLLHNTVMPYLSSLLLLGCFICCSLLSKPLQLALGLLPVLPPVMLLLLLLLIHIINRVCTVVPLLVLLPTLLPPLLLLLSLALLVLLPPLRTLLLLLLQVLHVLLVLLLVLRCVTLVITAVSSRPWPLALLLLLFGCFCSCLVKRVLQQDINKHPAPTSDIRARSTFSSSVVAPSNCNNCRTAHSASLQSWPARSPCSSLHC